MSNFGPYPGWPPVNQGWTCPMCFQEVHGLWHDCKPKTPVITTTGSKSTVTLLPPKAEGLTQKKVDEMVQHGRAGLPARRVKLYVTKAILAKSEPFVLSADVELVITDLSPPRSPG